MSFSTLFTSEFLGNVSSSPELIKFAKSVKRDGFSIDVTKLLVEKYVSFIECYIDQNKLVASPHAKEWDTTNDSVSYHEKKMHLIKTVTNMITKQSYDEKVDKSFGDYLKRLTCNVIGDALGGFSVMSTIPEAEKTMSDIGYLKSNKKKNMRDYITKTLSTYEYGGIVACLEHDHGCVFDGGALTADENQFSSNNSDSEMGFDIHYIELNPNVHKDNSAKGIYYTSNFTIEERSSCFIKEKMKETGNDKYIGDFDKYDERFSVLYITDVGTEDDPMFYGTPFVLLHNKSCGSKMDILEKNSKEYRFIRTVKDTFEENDNGFLMGGDINVPLLGEDNGYMKISEKDTALYPVRRSYDCDDHETFMFYGLEFLSPYDIGSVGFKKRKDDISECSQCIIGKYDSRNYHTDYMFGKNINFTIDSCALHPDLRRINLQGEDGERVKCGKQVRFPLIDTLHFWGSDHQAVEHGLNGTSHKANFVIYNTLSNCCSNEQHFKSNLEYSEIAKAKVEFLNLLNETVKHVTFTTKYVDLASEMGITKTHDEHIEEESDRLHKNMEDVLSAIEELPNDIECVTGREDTECATGREDTECANETDYLLSAEPTQESGIRQRKLNTPPNIGELLDKMEHNQGMIQAYFPERHTQIISMCVLVTITFLSGLLWPTVILLCILRCYYESYQ